MVLPVHASRRNGLHIILFTGGADQASTGTLRFFSPSGQIVSLAVQLVRDFAVRIARLASFTAWLKTFSEGWAAAIIGADSNHPDALTRAVAEDRRRLSPCIGIGRHRSRIIP